MKPITITEKPGLLDRNPKGPTWRGGYWKEWNGAGGENFAHAHSWGRYIPEGHVRRAPRILRDGRRRQAQGRRLALHVEPRRSREMFANHVIAVIKGGTKHPSISPPDGRGYCQCDEVQGPGRPEGRSSRPAAACPMSNRYADFFDDVGRRVAKECPDSVLSFYVLRRLHPAADGRARSSSPNLCAVIAPIRYCRLHALGDPNCPSRKQQVEMVDGWAKVASRLGYYNYMYNLADATLPMFKFTPCQEEFPYLADDGPDVHDHRGAVELVHLRPANLPEPAAGLRPEGSTPRRSWTTTARSSTARRPGR